MSAKMIYQGCIGVGVEFPKPMKVTAVIGGHAKVGVEFPKPMKVTAGFVCAPSKGSDKWHYLRVTPDIPMWITVDSGIAYDIHSNTEWIIE